VENFINARPREWVGLIGFRATRVEADMGFIEYKIVGEHREAWQNIGRYISIVFTFTRKIFYDDTTDFADPTIMRFLKVPSLKVRQTLQVFALK